MNTTNFEQHIWDQQIAVENKKDQYKQQRRPLIWYGNVVVIVLILFILSIIVVGFLNNAYYNNFAVWIAVLAGFLLIFLTIYFFLNYDSSDGEYGFRGIERIRTLISLRTEIEDLETQVTIWETYQTQQLSHQERYKNQLPQIVAQYQRQANGYRKLHYSIQMSIILLSLLVSGLTSGLTGLIGASGTPWIAPALSLSVSFLTSLIVLFRFHDRGFNLQQTADSIEFEIHSSELRIFDYKGLDDEQALCELAERAERLRNEQRKRQQQLEQSSQTKPASD